jgi:hypothetical protein
VDFDGGHAASDRRHLDRDLDVEVKMKLVLAALAALPSPSRRPTRSSRSASACRRQARRGHDVFGYQQRGDAGYWRRVRGAAKTVHRAAAGCGSHDTMRARSINAHHAAALLIA